jgi:hypothetical protein
MRELFQRDPKVLSGRPMGWPQEGIESDYEREQETAKE